MFAGNARAAAVAISGSAAPDQPEPSAVPGDHGLGSNDDQGSLPAGPQPSEQDPEGAIAASQSGMLPITLVDRELLAECEVLQCEVCPGTQERPQQGDEKRYQ